MPLRHRSIFGDKGHTFFITTTVMNFDRIFALDDAYYLILIESLKHLIQEHRASLFAYVLMPSHIHLILFMPRDEHISDFMRDFKKYTSTKIRQQLEKDGFSDRVERLRQNALGLNKRVFKFWMDRFDDVVIYSENILRTKINYIHENPVRAGLVSNITDWKYSSARNYLRNDHSILFVDTDWSIRE